MLDQGFVANAPKRFYRYSGLWWLENRIRAHHLKSVFIWIPKCAGTSIYHALNKIAHCPKLKSLRKIKFAFAGKGLVTFNHIRYLSLIRDGYVSGSFASKAYTFCFVRNPYARAVSLWKYYLLPQIRPIDIQNKMRTFKNFCRHINGYIEPIGLYNSKELSLCNPQSQWITREDGSFYVDFIGRLESIQEDFDILARNLGASYSTRIMRFNRSKHRPYLDYYDGESLTIINKLYQIDFENFGYKMINTLNVNDDFRLCEPIPNIG